MVASIVQYSDNAWSKHAVSHSLADEDAQLVLCFAAIEILKNDTLFATVRTKFPKAEIAICSTAGEIYQDIVHDNTLVAVAMAFGHTRIQTAKDWRCCNMGEMAFSTILVVELPVKFFRIWF